METFEKKIQLPSNGLCGGPKEIVLRAMTTKEEKILLTSRDFNVFERLVKSCCVEPKDLDVGTLHQNDILYLTYALRSITFGDSYKQTFECSHCGRQQETEINISEMNVNILDTDGIEDKLKVVLPVNGDNLQLKVLSNGDIKRLDRQAKLKAQNGKLQDPESYSFIIKLMETIQLRNGEDFENNEEKRNYVENLHMQDLVAIQNTLSNIEFGLDNRVIRTCNSCYEDEEVSGLITPEFFRPRS